MDPGRTFSALDAYPYSTAGAPLASAKINARLQSADLFIGPTDATLRMLDSFQGFGGDPSVVHAELRIGADGKVNIHTNTQPFDTPKALTAAHPIEMLLGYSHWGYNVRETAPGYVYQYNAKETTLTLPNKTSIVVPKSALHPGAQPRIFASPKADRVALVWDDWELACDPNTSIPGKYRAAVIDIATKRVTPLGSGSGTGFAAFDGGGVLYLQKGRVTARIDVDDAGTVRESPLPDGVLRAPPMASDNECGF